MRGGGALDILLVDDDRSLCDSLTEVLSNTGFSVTSVYTGVEAIRTAKDRHFDVAIIDVRLPDLDGNEVLQWLRAGDPELSTLMLSGAATLEDAVKALNLGADAFILKPVDPEDLISRIRKIARVRMLERRLRESERQYRELVENSFDGIILVGLDWKIKFANRSFLKMLGLTREEALGKSFLSFIRPFNSALLLKAVQDPLKKGRGVLPQFTMRCGNGDLIRVEASVSLLERDGVPAGIQMILRDTDPWKRAEAIVMDIAPVPDGSPSHASSGETQRCQVEEESP